MFQTFQRTTLAAMCLVAASFGSGEALAASWTVESPSYTDQGDDNPGDGNCQDSSGVCTLRAAIEEANAYPGNDIVEVPTGNHIVTNGEIEIDDDVGSGPNDLLIISTLGLRGAPTTIIDANHNSRIFNITDALNVEILGITLQEGASSAQGGAIRNSAGTLTLTGVVVQNSQGSRGGGITNHATLIINNTRLVGNQASSSGGGIFNIATMTVASTQISGNTADIGGGVSNVSGGSAAFTDVVMTKNSATGVAGRGGGFLNDNSTAAIQGGQISYNQSAENGGGFHNNNTDLGQPTSLIGVRLIGNTAEQDGGGVFNSTLSTMSISQTDISQNVAGFMSDGDGGGIFNSGTMEISQSLLSYNNANGSGNGGGLLNTGAINQGGVLNIVNSTISHNSAVQGGGLYNSSVSIDDQNPRVTVLHATFFLNNARLADGGSHVYNQGADAGLSVQNTIIDTGIPITPTLCAGNVGGIISLGNNIERFNSCGFNATGDLPSTAPMLLALSANGGPTMTHALQSGSPAINGAATAACPSVDQRGSPRATLMGCDIGAYERVGMMQIRKRGPKDGR